MGNALDHGKIRIFSGSWLKLLAVVSMFIDHFACVIGQNNPLMHAPLFELGGEGISLFFLMRKIGRPAFPIFCFLVAEGYLHTRNRLKYGRNMLVFALLSEIPFNLMVGNAVLYPSRQNVYFTLLLGLIFMAVYDQNWKQWHKGLCFIALSLVAVAVQSDYGLRGALLVLLLYALREQPALRTILSYPLLSSGVAAFTAFVPINLYNGQRGFIQSRWMKYAFYLFYPIHILLLWVVKNCAS